MGMAAILVMWSGPFEQTFVSHPMEALYEIWLWLAKRFLRRRCLNSVDDGRRQRRPDNGACLYFKLTYEPKGSGELMIYLSYVNLTKQLSQFDDYPT